MRVFLTDLFAQTSHSLWNLQALTAQEGKADHSSLYPSLKSPGVDTAHMHKQETTGFIAR